MFAVTLEATGVLLAGMGTLLAAVVGMIALLVTIWRGQKQVHVLVNSQLQAVVDALAAQDIRVAQLEARFVELGIDVPPEPGA